MDDQRIQHKDVLAALDAAEANSEQRGHRCLLLRGMARHAVIAGTATAVSNRVSRRQANKWTQQDAEQAAAGNSSTRRPPEPTQSAPTESRVDKLTQLAKLKEQGVLHRRGVRPPRERASSRAERTARSTGSVPRPLQAARARCHSVGTSADFTRRRTDLTGPHGCGGTHAAVPDRHQRTPRTSLAQRRASTGMVVRMIATLGAALAAGAVVIALRGDMPKPAGWLALRDGLAVALPIAVGHSGLARGDPTRGSAACSSSAASCGASSPSPRRPRPCPAASGASQAGSRRMAVGLPPAAPSRPGGYRAAPTGRSCCGSGAADGAAPSPDRVARRTRFPAPSTWATCATDCPANALQPGRRDASVG